MKIFGIVLAILMLLSGCYTSLNVSTTRQWEGHYFSTNDFYKATSNIQLDKEESIWVLSDRTLNNVLKNVK